MGNNVGHIDCVYLPVLSYNTDHWEGEGYDMHILTYKPDNIEDTYHTLKERGVSVSEIKIYDGNRFDVWSGWL